MEEWDGEQGEGMEVDKKGEGRTHLLVASSSNLLKYSNIIVDDYKGYSF